MAERISTIAERCCWTLTKIPEGARTDYEEVFGLHLTTDITHVCLVEPYLRTDIQHHLLKCFLELIDRKCPKIQRIDILTNFYTADGLQKSAYNKKQELAPDLLYRAIFRKALEASLSESQSEKPQASRLTDAEFNKAVESKISNVKFHPDYPKTRSHHIHDRSLTLSNGIHLVLGKGLGFYNTCGCDYDKSDKDIKNWSLRMKNHNSGCLKFFGDNILKLTLTSLQTQETMVTCFKNKISTTGKQLDELDEIEKLEELEKIAVEQFKFYKYLCGKLGVVQPFVDRYRGVRCLAAS